MKTTLIEIARYEKGGKPVCGSCPMRGALDTCRHEIKSPWPPTPDTTCPVHYGFSDESVKSALKFLWTTVPPTPKEPPRKWVSNVGGLKGPYKPHGDEGPQFQSVMDLAAKEVLPKKDFLCPLCKAKMVVRTNGRDGSKFYGCSTFPKCRGTREVDGHVSPRKGRRRYGYSGPERMGSSFEDVHGPDDDWGHTPGSMMCDD